MIHLVNESAGDRDEVEWLYELAFAPGRQALSSYRLRDGVAPVPELCVTARDEINVLAAAIRYWPVRIGKTPALLLGPVAVHPTRQGEGLGGLLIGETLGERSWSEKHYIETFYFHTFTGFTTNNMYIEVTVQYRPIQAPWPQRHPKLKLEH